MRTMTRRDLLAAPTPTCTHVSSAVVTSLPRFRDAVIGELSSMTGVEVHAHSESRIVITIEGATSGTLGDTLCRITLLDGVLAANMVFEQTHEAETVRS